MKVAILGGGFGLYGYLPALTQIPTLTISLSARNKERLKARHDISHLYDDIDWYNDDKSLINECDGIVIALPPTEQYTWINKCLNCKNITHILLEKPLASSPNLADDVLNNLKLSGKKFRIGYNFRYTSWGKDLLENIKNIKEMTCIDWSFNAHHYAKNIQTWKRQHTDGGGALRFYGIHLIALLAELGYNDASYSEIGQKMDGEAESWVAELIGPNLPPCKISISTKSVDTQFKIQSNNKSIVSLLQPFETTLQQNDSTMDQRIPFLVQNLTDLFFKDLIYYEWYKNANILWTNVEKRTLIS